MPDAVELGEVGGQASGEIMLEETKMRVMEEVKNVFAGGGEEGIDAGDIATLGEKGVNEVRAEESASTGDEMTERRVG